MRVTLYEPALAVNGKAYAGWANEGDELFFPHVDTCCALIIVGDKAAVGGHMGSQLPTAPEPNYDIAGRYVWELVLANHRRLNSQDAPCTVITVGETNWYDSVVASIWSAVGPDGVLPLKSTPKFCSKGIDIRVTMKQVFVQPCGTNTTITYDIPDGFQEAREIGL
jgi:hypothetical protein